MVICYPGHRGKIEHFKLDREYYDKVRSYLKKIKGNQKKPAEQIGKENNKRISTESTTMQKLKDLS